MIAQLKKIVGKIVNRNFLKKCLKFLIIFLIYLQVCDWAITFSVRKYVFTEVGEVPAEYVGVVLGTSKYMQDGTVNSFYTNRIQAATELYSAGKVKRLIVSGDNAHISYNEPETMKKDLIAQGVLEDAIYLDYAGFRTLDSVIRAKEVFGQNAFIVISQDFHVERAIFLGRVHGIEAYGYVAKAVGFNMWFRELFARQKMLLDLIFGKDPKFLGEKVLIN